MSDFIPETELDYAPTFEQIALYLAALPDWKFRVLLLKMYILSLDDSGCYVQKKNRAPDHIHAADLVDDLTEFERKVEGKLISRPIPTSHRLLLKNIILDVWDGFAGPDFAVVI